ncbi:IS110 family transposase [Halomonas gudaonensis]|uniref:Transposase IS116/IS110/IS902 family protein n=1 Tax=Billgrantia gudaonensis TaxID=376427 RepID=A0A1G9EW15_9GAMM|nr:Transposase IS116/IS110/IS902 family protein [Halomonas gudaonensis]
MTRRSSHRSRRHERLQVVHPDAAAIDIGSRFHLVAIPPDRDPVPVRRFESFTEDLIRLADWLVEKHITTVAMESTGVYWIPVFEILEERGLAVILANARDAKNVPGRKTDINDAQWLQRLHAYGLLRGSFRPSQELNSLRALVRHRERLHAYAASHIQHMQKALMEMNLQLHHVVTDITGKTGMRILRSIVSGQQDPAVLAAYRDPRCKASEATIRQALTGHYREEHLLALSQSLSVYDTYQTLVGECDRHIEAALKRLAATRPAPQAPLPPPRHREANPNAPAFDVRGALYHVIGTDLTQLHGFGSYLALKLIAECGLDMTRWPTAKHFTSWLALSPGSKISGGKVLSSRTRRTKNRAAALLRLAATTLSRTDTALGAFYRRLSSRIGKAKAVTATARKIAVLFYTTLRYGRTYQDPGVDYYEARYRQKILKNLRRRAEGLGYELTPVVAVEQRVS